MASTKGFSRDRTSAFTTLRQREHAHRNTFEERDSSLLLGGAENGYSDQGLSGVDAVSASVAPAWVDTQEELTTDMAIIKQKMGELSRCVGSHSRPPGPAYPLPPFLPPLALTPPGVRLDALPSFAGSTRRLSSRPLTTAATRTSR